MSESVNISAQDVKKAIKDGTIVIGELLSLAVMLSVVLVGIGSIFWAKSLVTPKTKLLH